METHVADAFRCSRASCVASCIDVTLTLLDLASIHHLTFSLTITSITGKAAARMLIAFCRVAVRHLHTINWLRAVITDVGWARSACLGALFAITLEAILALAVNTSSARCAFRVLMAGTRVVAKVSFVTDGAIAVVAPRTFAFTLAWCSALALCKGVAASMLVSTCIDTHAKLTVTSEACFASAHVLSWTSLGAPCIVRAETVVGQAVILLRTHFAGADPTLVAYTLVGTGTSHDASSLGVASTLVIGLAIIDGFAQ